MIVIGPAPGLSPRVRGNPHQRDHFAERQGSIPACAGEPPSYAKTWCHRMVYPRVCGGTCCVLRWLGPICGLSPRVRGNPSFVIKTIHVIRSIPACAGEPMRCPLAFHVARVYPRVCGGTAIVENGNRIGKGLSPRVRGNRRAQARRERQARSIPACAGEPAPYASDHDAQQVYPRVCGGNLDNLALAIPSERSIPACAGEPARQTPHDDDGRVYPRVCGGTRGKTPQVAGEGGLSPRVRGNLEMWEWNVLIGGSIPACAGEPVDQTRNIG